jgi:hypothetical protein
MRNSGIIYDLGNGKYGIAYNSEQREEFFAAGKVYVQVFDDELCTQPVLDQHNRPYKTLKQIKLIKQIGYND